MCEQRCHCYVERGNPTPKFTSSLHPPRNKSRPTTVVVETGVGRRAAPLIKLIMMALFFRSCTKDKMTIMTIMTIKKKLKKKYKVWGVEKHCTYSSVPSCSYQKFVIILYLVLSYIYLYNVIGTTNKRSLQEQFFTLPHNNSVSPTLHSSPT